jgi:hypothetical protein
MCCAVPPEVLLIREQKKLDSLNLVALSLEICIWVAPRLEEAHILSDESDSNQSTKLIALINKMDKDKFTAEDMQQFPGATRHPTSDAWLIWTEEYAEPWLQSFRKLDRTTGWMEMPSMFLILSLQS